MRIAVVARSKQPERKFVRALKALGATIDHKRPELVLSFGGDGTFLVAERLYPQVPKALVRVPRDTNSMSRAELKLLLAKIAKKKYRVASYDKLSAIVRARGKRYSFECSNDFVVRNTLPTHAVRFSLRAGSIRFDDLVGDGVVLATGYGSSAYFYSITRRTFTRGIGLAFNNMHKKRPHGVLPAKAVVRIRITRGPAVFCADNDKRFVHLRAGDTIVVRTAKTSVYVVEFH